MSKTVFILGAGASKQAGAPLMAEFLDVAYSLHKHEPSSTAEFALVFEARNALRRVHSNANLDLINLESLFAAFEMARLLGRLEPLPTEKMEQLPSAMTRLIQETLEYQTVFKVTGTERPVINAPVPYGQFAKFIAEKLSSGYRAESPQFSFITFNYDLCLDFALYSCGLLAGYCLKNEKEPFHVRLLKLHGSLNWARCDHCRSIIPLYLKDFFRNRISPFGVESYRLRMSDALRAFKHCGLESPSLPFIAPPTWNKTQYHEQLESVWQAAATELSDAENIFVCGYSLPETDQFFRFLYALGSASAAQLRRFWVFNPDKDVESRFRNLCGQVALSRFKFFPQTFDTAINDMRLAIEGKI